MLFADRRERTDGSGCYSVLEATKGSVDCVYQSWRALLSGQERPSLQVFLRSLHLTLQHRRLTKSRRGCPIPRPDQPPDVIEEPPPPANAEEFAGAADPARLMLAPGPAHRLVPTRAQEQFVMALSVEDFYTSSNGDRWQLVCDTASGRSFVRHEPNLSSGGRVTDTDVEEFLNRTGSSPENLALRALLDKRKGTGGS